MKHLSSTQKTQSQNNSMKEKQETEITIYDWIELLCSVFLFIVLFVFLVMVYNYINEELFFSYSFGFNILISLLLIVVPAMICFFC